MKKSHIYLAVVLLFTIQLLALAQDNSQSYEEQEKVKRVFIRGNHRIDEKTIKTWISTRRGDSYNLERLDGDIRALFDTGYFDDVKVFVEDAPRSGKIITFDLRDRPVISDVIYELDNSIDEANIAEELDSENLKQSKGDMYSPVKVRRVAKRMGEIISREWQRQVKVIPYVESMEPDEVVVIIRIRR
jgi:outer membrane protein insertion porin family